MYTAPRHVPSLAHDHLDAPIARFWLLVWRGDQWLPFPAPNGAKKACMQAMFDQNVAYSLSALERQTVIILHFPDAIGMPGNLHLDRLALCHLGQEGVQGGTRARHNVRTLFKEIQGKAERFGGLRRQGRGKNAFDLFLAERVLLDAAFRIDFGRPKGCLEHGGVLGRGDGHSADLSILAWE